MCYNNFYIARKPRFIMSEFQWFYDIIFRDCKSDIEKLIKGKREIDEQSIVDDLFDDYDWCSPGMTFEALRELRRQEAIKRRVVISLPYLGAIQLPSLIPVSSRNIFYSVN